MRTDEFDRILDDCLDRLARGSTVAQCVAAYPAHASRLEPLLRVVSRSRDACDFVPSPESARHARTQFRTAIASREAARAARRRPSLLDRLTATPLPLAAIASFAVIALTVLLVAIPLSPDLATPPATIPSDSVDVVSPPPDGTAVPSTPLPAEPEVPTEPPSSPDMIAAVPHPDGNYVFYLSDAPNDIADFESLTITIQSIELKPSDGRPWIRIIPTQTTADIALLQGDLAQELWRGIVPEGKYAAVLVHVSAIEGILRQSGTRADVTLPSDRLHVTTDFSVRKGATTEFVFDITVHRTGGAGQQARYILSPQADESGVGRPVLVVPPGMPAQDNPGKQPGPMGDDSPGDGPGPGNNTTSPEPDQDLVRPRYWTDGTTTD